ncbi:ABC-type sugar transport system, periplasmic component [Corynebacterium kutscheri]|uniref:ABC-type sugar transport system, periplasmic component n=1 Tax=Corynebacterium kutscheri TaxID=35755 RepID=A0A0F6TBU0_9CORY|nr:ABC-type sugar transport system, periplasmic component [Corynebacterium kutscheri]VEH10658.1 ABC transporter substrate-binding protein [Corynebacterium kutscheri]
MNKPLSVVKAATAVLLCLGLVSCSETGGAPRTTASHGERTGGVDTPRLTVSFITHGAPGDTFWDLVRTGAEDAAQKNNIELRYSSDPQAPNQANLVQSAIDAKVDGIALTLPNAQAIGPVAKKAALADIPVVALNAGMDSYRDYNISAFFGQEEKYAGSLAGKRLQEDGARHVLCVIHEQGNSSQEARCAGVAEGAHADVELLYVNGQDLASAQATIQAKLVQDPSIDWIMSLVAPVALRASEAVSSLGNNRQVKIATFDTNAELVDAINTGAVAWAVDQQPYLQGYMAVDALWLAHRNGSTVGGSRPVYTGPSFIDSTNVQLIEQAAKEGLR